MEIQPTWVTVDWLFFIFVIVNIVSNIFKAEEGRVSAAVFAMLWIAVGIMFWFNVNIFKPLL